MAYLAHDYAPVEFARVQRTDVDGYWSEAGYWSEIRAYTKDGKAVDADPTGVMGTFVGVVGDGPAWGTVLVTTGREARLALVVDEAELAIVTTDHVLLRAGAATTASSAVGLELPPGAPVAIERAESGMLQVRYQTSTLDAVGWLPARLLGRRWVLATRAPTRSRRTYLMVGPHSEWHDAPEGRPFARASGEVTLVEQRGSYALVVLNRPDAVLTGWVRNGDLRRERPMKGLPFEPDEVQGSLSHPPVGVHGIRPKPLPERTIVYDAVEGNPFGIVLDPGVLPVRPEAGWQCVAVRTAFGTIAAWAWVEGREAP